MGDTAATAPRVLPMKPIIHPPTASAAMASGKMDQDVPVPVPETITDLETKKTYIRGRFLGKVYLISRRGGLAFISLIIRNI